MHKKHFFLGDKIVEARDFTPQNQGFGQKTMPLRDRAAHAAYVKERYTAAVDQAIRLLDKREAEGQPVANGVYVDVEMDKSFVPDQYGKQDGRNGATIMKVTEKEDGSNVDVTVYVKREKKDWLGKMADEYSAKDTRNGEPVNKSKIVPINDVVCTDIRTLYISPAAFEAIPAGGAHTYELWLSHSKDYGADEIKDKLERMGIVQVAKPLLFEGVDVWLIQATKPQLCTLPLSLGYIEGIRPYRQPSVLVSSDMESREWSELIHGDIVYSDDAEQVQVGILDTGVNNAHKLLNPALPDERMDVAIGVPEATDRDGHGTGMAGLTLLGDLTDIAYRRDAPVEVHHTLSSVKIFEEGHDTPEEFYGAVIEEGISKASDMGATIQCMAITDDDSYDGTSTSSSAALDESIYHQGLCDRLVLVSAGNVKTMDVDHENYIESCKAHAVKSPAQAWNALTVGAYTEKVETADADYTPLAAPGGVSPFSCSSFPWSKRRIKPEIMMEGGNVAYHTLFKETTHPDLELITTDYDLAKSLQTFDATSAATGLAARLAATIKVENTDLSMLSVRGLMVHSAHWTKEMARIKDLDERMSLCGYGVPDVDAAKYSSENSATYIFENTLIPYKRGSSGGNSYNEWHLYDLPWPKELLEEMGKEDVKIRITLSYYVKPSPGYAGRTSPYRYPSATLHFDLKNAHETPQEFQARRNKNEGEKQAGSTSVKWTIGQQRRERGTVQSDWLVCTAAELAEMNQIVVFPGAGWWKERKLDNVDNAVPYSLIVTIETAETEIYSAVETAIANRIAIQIAQEV